MSEATANRYFLPPSQYFWQWADDGQVAAWADGSTITFAAELEIILARLTPHGLPPFGAVILVLAACRDNWRQTSRESGILNGLARVTSVSAEPRSAAPEAWMHEVLAGLDDLNMLPADLRTTAVGKATIAEVLFEDCGANGSVAAANALLAALHDGLAGEQLCRPLKLTQVAEIFRHDLAVLRRVLSGRRLDPARLRQRQRTSVDTTAQPAPADLSVAERTRALLQDFERDSELRGVARAARQLMAAVSLPKPLGTPQELPVGGISDLTNRGALDRLLVSELAHDDLTLALRVSLNEALYFRRESPPSSPPSRRLVLCDTGVRMWGTPRLMATAVGLAIQATAPTSMQIRTYRPNDDHALEIDLTTRDGVVEQLGCLQCSPHPGMALADLITAGVGDDCRDIVLITHPDVIADADFRRFLDVAGLPLYAITVARDGNVRLSAVSNRGQKLLKQACLEIDKLVAPMPTPDARPVRISAGGNRLPLIMDVTPFPLLLLHPVSGERATYSPTCGVVAASHDGRLLHWTQHARGARQLLDDLPKGRIRHIGISEWGQVTGLAANGRWYLAYDLKSGASHRTELEIADGQPLGYVVFTAAVAIIFSDHIGLHSTRTGECVQTIRLKPTSRWRGGRFFQEDGEWSILSMDAARGGHLQRVLPAGDPRHGRIKALFSRSRGEGPWALTEDHEFMSLTEGRPLRLRPAPDPPFWIMKVSQGGNRVGVQTWHGQARQQFVIDLTARTTTHINGPPDMFIEPEIWRMTHASGNLRRHFRSVFVTVDDCLGLVSRKGQNLIVNQQLQLERSTREQLSLCSFGQLQGDRVSLFELKAATWQDGSRAVLDGRGLLHLRSSDSSLPELTIVLAEPFLAGWIADGRRFGPAYYIGDATAAPTAAVVALIRSFAARIRTCN